MAIDIGAIRTGAAAYQSEAVELLRELVRTPSMSGREEAVIALLRTRMLAAGFDEVRVDPFGNLWGRIGTGSRVLAFDAHVDTVDVGDRSLWQVDPFGAELIDGVVYGRGASDQKAGMASMVYAGRLLKELSFEGDLTLWFIGSVLEEDCDGLCWHYILNEGLMRPDLVVLTEPTGLEVYRGHRGRMELEITLKGLSCHGSAPERGINAISRMAPVIGAIDDLPARLAGDAFLGAGSVTISEIRSSAPSLCAVADECTIHLDRRLTAGETDEGAMAELRAILDRVAPVPASAGREVAVRIAPDVISVPVFERPSHTGLTYPMRQYFPAWVLPADDPRLALALRARELSRGATSKGDRQRAAASTGSSHDGARPSGASEAGKWTFSTNGVATMGIHGVPTLGFGPAEEVHAHAPTDQCPVDHVGEAIAFYAALALLAAEEPDLLAER